MDVAGGGAREGSLAFLPLAEAQELRAALLARRDAVAGGSRSADDAATPGERSRSRLAPAPERVLATLDLRHAAWSACCCRRRRAPSWSSTLVFAGLFAVFGQIVGGLAAAVPVLGGFALTLFRKLSAYYGFTVAETSAGLQVRRGLFELDAQTIALARVQGVVVTEPLLWRRLGLGQARRRARRATRAAGRATGSRRRRR